MNDAAVKLGVPLIDCAMYDMETHLFTVLPGRTACVRCLYPEAPPGWRRRVSGLRRGLRHRRLPGRVEAIKLIAGIGTRLAGQMLIADLRMMTFRKLQFDAEPIAPSVAREGEAPAEPHRQ